MRVFNATVVWLMLATSACALDHVTFRRDAKEATVSGELVVKAQDGGLLLLSADGELWSIQPEEVIAHRTDDKAFAALSAAEAGAAMLKRLPEGFEVYSTAHYVICHNTSRAYAQWCGALYERLYTGFINFWSHKGITLHEPRLPLVCIVFADQDSYVRFAREELADRTDNIVAYYSLRTNRITMFDLTGLEALRQPSDSRGTTAQINQMLARPAAERMVATVIHEATHQLAYNCGLHQRFADIPLWVSEGVAMYFEAPDLSNSKGWKTIGAVNRPRLRTLREYSAQRPTGSLHSLISDDKRLRDPRQVSAAYAEAWALNYFLIRQRPKEYVAYLKKLSQKGPLLWDEPQERLAEFKAAFGELDKLDAEFLRHMQKVR
jgi:Protein of unknown function (DUF1570)